MSLFTFLLENPDQVLDKFIEHFILFLISWLLAVVISFGFSIIVTRTWVSPKVASVAVSITGATQAVPSMAIIALIFLVTGIGMKPAIIALFLYSLAPIIFNTTSGFRTISPRLIESATGMGMTPLQILLKVEIPQVMPAFFSGIRTAATINIGTATVASAIGAGGLGELIFVGLRMIQTDRIFAGAFPAALMALAVDFLLAMVEKGVTSKGIRLELNKI
ncbi:MAG: ABC transporter permease [Spirochaetales bacterium]|nr:ABC transporter permease [Spirochaetales bacterium]